ncbi:MAG TPA: FAD-binding protein [Thermomicrobiales bacterium]|nr:FAD-binding protein [Thermomicrobiales bacterium]
MVEERRNWAGNVTYQAARVYQPATLAEVQALVAGSRTIKALGSRHSFNTIADSPGEHISLERLAPRVTIDRERRTATVAAGVRYGELGQQLHRAGFALTNLASLPHISVAGACATATHGSGDRNGNLATAVAALELVTADGTVVRLSERDGDAFRGAAVGLGALGVVTALTLSLVPTFAISQVVYENLALDMLLAHFDEITGSAYSVSLFTDWRDARFNQVWLKQRVTDEDTAELNPDFFDARPAARKLHPIASLSAESCTEQLGLPGPWYERLTHFRPDVLPSSGDELQSEYFVPRQHARAALQAIAGLRDRIAPLLQIAEVRTIAADDLWLSPCYERDSVAFHFTWTPDWPAVSQFLPVLEDQLAPFDVRPHWGKLFTLAPARLHALYPKLPDFQALLRRYDPQGKFRNAFLAAYVVGA